MSQLLSEISSSILRGVYIWYCLIGSLVVNELTTCTCSLTLHSMWKKVGRIIRSVFCVGPNAAKMKESRTIISTFVRTRPDAVECSRTSCCFLASDWLTHSGFPALPLADATLRPNLSQDQGHAGTKKIRLSVVWRSCFLRLLCEPFLKLFIFSPSGFEFLCSRGRAAA